MRGVTAPLREEPPPAVHASPAGPITAKVLARVLLVATAIALFLILVAALGPPTPARLKLWAMYLLFSWTGALLGMAAIRLLALLRFPWRYPLLVGAAGGLVMFPPMSAVVWFGVTRLMGEDIPLDGLPRLLWQTGLICIGASTMAVLTARRTTVIVQAREAPPKFLDRLPLKLRGAEVWAVEAEDHYLRLHTSKGQDLILMRLADAVAELEGIEGMQVHRSWWVARDAITEARRGDGRATLTLKDGSEVPASRTYAAELRKRGWI